MAIFICLHIDVLLLVFQTYILIMESNYLFLLFNHWLVKWSTLAYPSCSRPLCMWVALFTHFFEHIRCLFMFIHLFISLGRKHHLHLGRECLHDLLANSSFLAKSKALLGADWCEKATVILSGLSVNNQVAFVYVVLVLLSWLVMEGLVFNFSVILLENVFQNVLSCCLDSVIWPISLYVGVSDWNYQPFGFEVWGSWWVDLVLNGLFILYEALRWLLWILVKVMELLISLVPISWWLLLVVLSHLFTVKRVVLALNFGRTSHWWLSVKLTATTLHLLSLDYISHIGCSALIMRSGEGSDWRTMINVLRIIKLSLFLKFHLLIWS